MRTRQEWKNIDGIAYIEDEKVKTTRMRPLIQDLDELPFMATDFLEELQLKHGKNVTAYLVSKDYIEFEYQKSVQRFNRFLDEVMNMNVWKYIDKYNNIFMQENL